MKIQHHASNLPVDVDSRLDELATRYRGAGGVGINVLNLIGSKTENLMDYLPEPVLRSLESVTQAALWQAMRAAQSSRSFLPDQKGWLNHVAASALGAAGGAGGVPSVLAELPVTTALLLRVIQNVAIEYDFDPDADNVQFDCVHIFSAAGPLAEDDDSDLGFLSARMALSSTAMQALIAKIAPKLAIVFGKKLAAQAVPVVGAMAGAATNYAFTSYYQDIAHVHFGMRRLAIEADISEQELVEMLREKIEKPLVRQA